MLTEQDEMTSLDDEVAHSSLVDQCFVKTE